MGSVEGGETAYVTNSPHLAVALHIFRTGNILTFDEAVHKGVYAQIKADSRTPRGTCLGDIAQVGPNIPTGIWLPKV